MNEFACMHARSCMVLLVIYFLNLQGLSFLFCRGLGWHLLLPGV